MKWHKETVKIATRGKGLYPFTEDVEQLIRSRNIREGMCFLFIQHTSASLVISESYDPSARADMESYMDRLVPENQPWYEHTLEGEDDSPSHIRSMLTSTSLSIPVDEGKLNLGIWQGIYLFEHRSQENRRRVLVRILQVE